MKARAWSIAALAALLVAGSAFAGPLKVKTLGTKSQTTEMCPNCKDKVSCAKVGDYTIGFTANVDNPKSGNGKIAVNVKDRSGKPVDDATVTVKLSMPKHGHDIAPLELKHTSAGWYEAPHALVMPGAWQADVTVTTKGGDKVNQAFSFTR